MLAVLALVAVLPAAGAQAASPAAFPKSFFWGVSLAGFQSEMGQGRDLDRGTDWWAWTHDRANIAAGVTSGDLPENGPGFYRRSAADIRLARRGLHANMFRLSIEWSRIFPRSTAAVKTGSAVTLAQLHRLDRLADHGALAHYRGVLRRIDAAGMTPFVTINHFTLPSWIHDPLAVRDRLAGTDANAALPKLDKAGWLDHRTVDEFRKYAAYLAWKLGDVADYWAPLNEPMVVATSGYANIPGVFAGNFPPGAFTFTGAIEAVHNLALANAAAYDSVKRWDRDDADRDGRRSVVGLVQNMVAFTPGDPSSPTDVAATRHADYLFNRLFINAAVKGVYDLNANGTADPGERRPKLAHKADFIGVNYYFRGRVTGTGAALTPRIGVLDFLPRTSYRWAGAPTAPTCPTSCSDFGSEIYPEGFRHVLRTASSYGLPLIVTENGIADAADRTRPGLPRPPPPRAPAGDREGHEGARLHRVVADRQLRVGLRLRPEVRSLRRRPANARAPAAHRERRRVPQHRGRRRDHAGAAAPLRLSGQSRETPSRTSSTPPSASSSASARCPWRSIAECQRRSVGSARSPANVATSTGVRTVTLPTATNAATASAAAPVDRSACEIFVPASIVERQVLGVQEHEDHPEADGTRRRDVVDDRQPAGVLPTARGTVAATTRDDERAGEQRRFRSRSHRPGSTPEGGRRRQRDPGQRRDGRDQRERQRPSGQERPGVAQLALGEQQQENGDDRKRADRHPEGQRQHV